MQHQTNVFPKNKILMENLDQIRHIYYSKMGKISSLYMCDKQSSHSLIQRALDRPPEYQGIGYLLSALNNPFFQRAASGEVIRYGYTTFTLPEWIDHLRGSFNKQCLWLMVDAFEAFQVYLVHAYALCGYTEPEIWHERHFGSGDSNQPRDLEWFRHQSSQIKGRPHSILERLRLRLDGLKQTEETNIYGIDLKFMICMVSSLRHSIVHSGGYVHDLKKFKNEVFRKSGHSTDSEKSNLIDYFFSQDGGISLTLAPSKADTYAYHDRVELIISWLMSYADLIQSLLIDRYGKT